MGCTRDINGRSHLTKETMSNRDMMLFGLFILLAVAGASHAEINLELRPVSTCYVAGELVEIELYAVSDDQTDQSISAIDAILVWDAEVIALDGNEDNGPYSWSGFGPFTDDSLLDGLNDTWDDGDALYTVLANFSDPAMATPEGLLVTTFRFEALHGSVAATSGFLESFGSYSTTTVYSGDSVNQRVTGMLIPTELAVQRNPARGADLSDFAMLQRCFSGEGGITTDGCTCLFDSDTDGDVDLVDLDGFLVDFDEPEAR